MKKILALLAAVTVSITAFADEGMWLLPLIQQMNKKDMARAGCKLSPSDIYSVNHSSLKDAIVQFGGGCTGEMISAEGLLVTNHHCGYSSIQGLSDDDHNYLMDGFWALTREQEIPVPGLTVTFLVKMEDVTRVIERDSNAEEQLVRDAEAANPGCHAEVTGFYNDNVHYLIVYRTFKDVRFVGAPPASMGKFGGETDNWMWPRHTCDFSMFRVYSAPDGSPAEYSADNVPMRPARHLKISLQGVQENDFTMILGYPGRTQRFQTAAELESMIALNRIRIDARTVRQAIMWDAMCADPGVQLRYADKYASSANGWKKWQGEELAFRNLDIIGRQLRKEEDLQQWINAKPSRVQSYGTAIADIATAVNARQSHMAAVTLLSEAPFQIEVLGFAAMFFNKYMGLVRSGDDDAFNKACSALEDDYHDYVLAIDRQEAVAMLNFYRERAAAEDQLAGIDNVDEFVNNLFENSVFTSIEKLRAADPENLYDDPAVQFYNTCVNALMPHYQVLYGSGDTSFSDARKAYAAAMLEHNGNAPIYPDANFTMRLTYGNVLPYSPRDGVQYRHFTTLRGVLEKEDPTNPEFIVPARLSELYYSGDYGRWADSDGTIHTCFLTNNDITGGNSGSPVLNAWGELVGLAFDGNWESMSSDVMFEPELQRCICVDIRYVLFMVEKYGGASNIIDELTFARKH